MFRLLVVLSAGLFLTLLIAGRDRGQTRLGLVGAYDIAVLKPEAKPAGPSAAEPRTAPVATVAAVSLPAAEPVAAATPASFSLAQEPPQAGVISGLTLALPREDVASAADPDVQPVQTGSAGEAALTQVGYVVGTKVNVRDAPSAKAAVLDRLARGEAVTVLGEGAPGWSMIRIEGDGVEGFVATRYLSVTPPESVN